MSTVSVESSALLPLGNQASVTALPPQVEAEPQTALHSDPSADEISPLPGGHIPPATDPEPAITESTAEVIVGSVATKPIPVVARPLNESPKKRRTKRKIKVRTDSKLAGLPTILKVALPVLMLAGIAAGAVKYWPRVQEKFGLGGSAESSLADAPPVAPVGGEQADVPSEFKNTDGSVADAPANLEPVIPSPEAPFSAERGTEPVSYIKSRIAELTEPLLATSAMVAEEDQPQEKPEERAQVLLEQALAASSVDDLLQFVLAPERVRTKMEEYYAGGSPALESTSIIYNVSVPITDSDGDLKHSFFVSTKTQPMRFPTVIEDTEDGPKLDWERFIELHDDHLGKFLLSPQSDEQTFHIILERRHYFDNDVPGLGSKDCFRISPPIPGTEGYAFIDKDAIIAKDCAIFKWDQICFPLATLRWTTRTDEKPYLEIKKIVETNWRVRGTTSTTPLD